MRKSMNMIKRNSVFWLLFACLFFTLGSPVHAKPLTAVEIKKSASGKTFSYSGRYSGVFGTRSNGTAWLKSSKGRSKTGKWWISGNKFCRKWNKEKAQCATWTPIGGGKFKTSNGYTLTPK